MHIIYVLIQHLPLKGECKFLANKACSLSSLYRLADRSSNYSQPWPGDRLACIDTRPLWMAGSSRKEIIPHNVDTVFISCHPIKLQLSQVEEHRIAEKQEKNERSQHCRTLSLRHISPDFGRARWKESASRTWQRTARCGPAATGGLQLNARSTFFHSFCPCHRAEDRGSGKKTHKRIQVVSKRRGVCMGCLLCFLFGRGRGVLKP